MVVKEIFLIFVFFIMFVINFLLLKDVFFYMVTSFNNSSKMLMSMRVKLDLLPTFKLIFILIYYFFMFLLKDLMLLSYTIYGI